MAHLRPLGLAKAHLGSIIEAHKPPHTCKNIGSHLSLYLVVCTRVRHSLAIFTEGDYLKKNHAVEC